MKDEEIKISDLKEKVKKFCEEREWDQFHGAKELAIALIIEAAELLEHFRWKSEKEVKEMFKNEKKKEQIEDELADVLYFILRFSQMYHIDISTTLERKIKKNEKKYPIDKFKGSNKKYNEVG